MPNEILFVGGRRDSISVLSGDVAEITDNTRFDPAYSDCALRIDSGFDSFKIDLYTETSNVLTKTSVSATTVFVHFAHRFTATNNTNSSTAFVTLVDAAGFPWFSIRGSSTLASNISFNIFWNSGTGAVPVWTEIGTPTNITTALETWDIEFTFGSPHSVNVYRNGSIWRNGTFTQAAFTNIGSVLFSRSNAGAGNPVHDLSQMIVTDNISTIGSFVRTMRATGTGTYTDFTGNHTLVNEAIGSDITVQTANIAGLRTTHVMSDVTVPTGLEIKTIFHWLRAKNDGTAPNNIRSVLRSSGADFVTADMPLINIGFSPVGSRYNADPFGTNWVASVWNSIEAGYESAT